MCKTPKLPVVPLPGLLPESLGNYLASLGLLRLLARRWHQVRIAWKEGVLQVVGGPGSLDALLDCLMDVASNHTWTPYHRGWVEKQKESTKRKSGAPLAAWQAQAPEEALELFSAHVVPRHRLHFNPLLGTGGNASKRAFSDGWRKACEELQQKSNANPQQPRDELRRLLLGERVLWMLEGLQAASWFSGANKLYNSGQNPFRQGLISPWAMALACEGLPFFSGAPSKRLGSRARAVGAFPFVLQAAAPSTAGEAGRDSAEVWVPLWDRPMSLPEVRALFARGRAEVRGRGATTPAAFATAIVGRGVDAGVVAFLRFALGRTTSAKTFEPRFEGRVALPQAESRDSRSRDAAALAEALRHILELFERLPRDRKKGKRWRFAGLRGPVEHSLIELAASPSDPVKICSCLDAVVAALDKVDRNQGYRAYQISWQPLPIEWLPALFGADGPPPEARLALAAVSGFPASQPFALYRFGAEWKDGTYFHPRQAPQRWVWGAGALPRLLANVLLRRVLDWELASKKSLRTEVPARILIPAACDQVSAWLNGQLDEDSLELWLSRLALFDWRFIPQFVLDRFPTRRSSSVPLDGVLALFALFQPLFDLEPLRVPGSRNNLLAPESGARTPAAARRAFALIRAGQIDSAVDFAISRYATANTYLVKTLTQWMVENPDRLLASFLFPVSLHQRGMLIRRWIRPQKATRGEFDHVRENHPLHGSP